MHWTDLIYGWIINNYRPIELLYGMEEFSMPLIYIIYGLLSLNLSIADASVTLHLSIADASVRFIWALLMRVLRFISASVIIVIEYPVISLSFPLSLSPSPSLSSSLYPFFLSLSYNWTILSSSHYSHTRFVGANKHRKALWYLIIPSHRLIAPLKYITSNTFHIP